MKGRLKLPLDDVLVACAIFLDGKDSRASVSGKRTPPVDAGNERIVD